MKWNTITKENPLPKDGSTYLALFKGQFCLVQYGEESKAFFMMWMPCMYQECWKIPDERVNKFTHYAVLEHPEDY